jgi:hypothetical protein
MLLWGTTLSLLDFRLNLRSMCVYRSLSEVLHLRSFVESDNYPLMCQRSEEICLTPSLDACAGNNHGFSLTVFGEGAGSMVVNLKRSSQLSPYTDNEGNVLGRIHHCLVFIFIV